MDEVMGTAIELPEGFIALIRQVRGTVPQQYPLEWEVVFD